jgi:hypothetical protein
LRRGGGSSHRNDSHSAIFIFPRGASRDSEHATKMTASRIRRIFPAVLAVALFGAAQVHAQYKVESVSEPPPSEVSAAIRDTLQTQALRVTGPSGVVCEIWMRKAIPGTVPNAQLGVVFTQIQEGTLTGAVRFAANLTDYRKQDIKAGVYTLRYALSPVNGDHQGVAPQRDFFLATPAAVDQNPANLSADQTIENSRKSTTTNHPSPWSLAPGDNNIAAPPSISHDTDDDWWIIQFTVPISAGGTTTPTRMGLVVAGSAAEV